MNLRPKLPALIPQYSQRAVISHGRGDSISSVSVEGPAMGPYRPRGFSESACRSPSVQRFRRFLMVHSTLIRVFSFTHHGYSLGDWTKQSEIEEYATDRFLPMEANSRQATASIERGRAKPVFHTQREASGGTRRPSTVTTLRVGVIGGICLDRQPRLAKNTTASQHFKAWIRLASLRQFPPRQLVRLLEQDLLGWDPRRPELRMASQVEESK
jgi:hypothetical protein